MLRFCFGLMFLYSLVIDVPPHFEVLADGIKISISKERKGGKVYQKWRIINKNKFSIYVPCYDSPAINPRYQAMQVGENIVVFVGLETIEGMSYGYSTSLLRVLPNDTINVDVFFAETPFKAPNDSTYDKLQFYISFDYLGKEYTESISKSINPERTISGENYDKYKKLIQAVF